MQTKLKTYRRMPTARISPWKLIYLYMLLGLFTACTDFVEVELPKHQLSTEEIFNDPVTVEAALKGIYGKMRTSGFSSGSFSGLSTSMGLYTDELLLYAPNEQLEPFQNHSVLANNTVVKSKWDSAYNQIYTANAIIEGLEGAETLTMEDKAQYRGEALFIRGYLHLLLVAFFGDIPYIMTTDYTENTTVSRMSEVLVYTHLIADLELASELLSATDITTDGSRTRPYAAVAKAVLARAYLYNENWEDAEASATRVISEFGLLEPDLDKVFLKDATGTIWQLKPNNEGENTREGAYFIFNILPPKIALNETLFFAFESGGIQQNDQRRSKWIKAVSNANGTETWRHAYKYKERDNTGSSSVEYSILLRLAEQYLIRAEARAHLGDISGAQADLNAIRNRAGLGNTSASTLNELLDAILQERRVELFTEMGHRWFDLKRMGKAIEVLAPIKPGWRDTDILFPIPEYEISLNPNLLPQNEGY